MNGHIEAYTWACRDCFLTACHTWLCVSAAVLREWHVTGRQQTRWLAFCIHFHFPSILLLYFQSEASLTTTTRSAHTHHTRTFGAASSSLTNWLWFALSNSAALPPAFWVLCLLTRTVTCVSLPPLHSFDHLTIWWISARLRQGLRHGRIRYKLSLLQGTASHHGSFSCLHLSFPTLLFLFISFVVNFCYLFISTKTSFDSSL